MELLCGGGGVDLRLVADAAKHGRGRALEVLKGAGVELPAAPLAASLGRAALAKRPDDVEALLRLRANPALAAVDAKALPTLLVAQAGTAGAKRQQGNAVVLAAGLAEKEGLRAGEVATVSSAYGIRVVRGDVLRY